jgi:hypothetical protein
VLELEQERFRKEIAETLYFEKINFINWYILYFFSTLNVSQKNNTLFGFGKLGFEEFRFGKLGFGKLGFGKLDLTKFRFGKLSFGKLGLGKFGIRKLGGRQVQ